MKSFQKAFAVVALLAASLANAQVSDSTAIAGIAGAAPTLDCAANQVKVGSSCALIVHNGVSEGGACTTVGWGTIGFTSGGLLLSCQGGTWKKASGTPPAAPAGTTISMAGCPGSSYPFACGGSIGCGNGYVLCACSDGVSYGFFPAYCGGS